MISDMSYDLFGWSGTIVCSDSSRRSTGSCVGRTGGSSRLFWGRKVISSRISVRHSSSLSAAKWATPDVVEWVVAPPSSSADTASCVTDRITSGPVTNMYEVFFTMKTKSVIAGEYTAPPEHGPMTAETWGTTPEARVLRRKISAYPASETTPSWIRAPPESLRPMTGVPVFSARSITLQILRAYASEREPPKTVKSWAKTNAGRPWIRPDPVTTPSPSTFWFCMSKSWLWCTTNLSISVKEPGSSRSSSRSRAVFFPALCCRRTRSSSPASSASTWRRRSSSNLSCADIKLLVSLTFAPFSTNNSDPMPLWAQTLLTLAALVLMLALAAAVWALRRVAQRAEGVLTIVEEELRPLVGQAHGLTEDVRALTREAGRELERIGAVADKVESVADGFTRFVGVLGGLTRAGQLVGVAAGVKKGVEAFVQRLRKNQGDDHE